MYSLLRLPATDNVQTSHFIVNSNFSSLPNHLCHILFTNAVVCFCYLLSSSKKDISTNRLTQFLLLVLLAFFILVSLPLVSGCSWHDQYSKLFFHYFGFCSHSNKLQRICICPVIVGSERRKYEKPNFKCTRLRLEQTKASNKITHELCYCKIKSMFRFHVQFGHIIVESLQSHRIL